jgi:hypothetical protein
MTTLTRLSNGVQSQVKDFIDNDLIPHIIRNYFKDGYYESLQYVWTNNVGLVKGLDVSKTPPYSLQIGPYNHGLVLEDEIKKCKEENKRLFDQYYRDFDNRIDQAFVSLEQQRRRDRIAANNEMMAGLGIARIEEPEELDEPQLSAVTVPIIEEPEEQSNNSPMSESADNEPVPEAPVLTQEEQEQLAKAIAIEEMCIRRAQEIRDNTKVFKSSKKENFFSD